MMLNPGGETFTNDDFNIILAPSHDGSRHRPSRSGRYLFLRAALVDG
jgi:hypothetical protein